MDIQEQINMLHFHQKLLLEMVENNTKNKFYKLVIDRKLTEKNVNDFYELCERLSKKMEEQKAEGLIYFHPLVKEMEEELHRSLQIQEVTQACLSQHLYEDLMMELKKWLD